MRNPHARDPSMFAMSRVAPVTLLLAALLGPAVRAEVEDFPSGPQLQLLTFDDLCDDVSWVRTNDSGFENRFEEFDGVELDDVAKGTMLRSLVDDFDNDVMAAGEAEQAEEEEEKHEEVDCFGLSKTLQKMFKWMFKPQSSETIDTKFYLSTRRNRTDRRMFRNGVGMLQRIQDIYRPRLKTVVIVHGFMSNSDMFWVRDMADALLSTEDLNVIAVDWGGGSMSWKYWKAVGNTRVVGRELAMMLKYLIKLGTPRSSLHLIGHSLGAHICGFAAKEVGGNIGRITGLDPAQPCFKSGETTHGLLAKDAMFVDILHTNGKLLGRLGLGLPEPIGLIDFYPNGGELQPGCTIKSGSLWDSLPISKTKLQNAICSHGRSYQYFIDALRSRGCRMWGKRWDFTPTGALLTTRQTCAMDTCAPLGLEAQKYPAKGAFFVATRDRTPYCIVDEATEKRMGLLSKIKKLFKNGFGSG